MILSRAWCVGVLVVGLIALTACGSSGTSSSSSTAGGSGSGVAAARQKCLDATKNIQNSTARSTAEDACNQLSTNNANVRKALSKAKRTCLDAAGNIPIASLKRSAEAQCKKITP